MIENEWARMFEEERDSVRQEAKEKISEIQRENARSFNKRRKKALIHKEGDLIAIKRIQLGPGLKFRDKFLGPYKVIKRMRNRYIVSKVDHHEAHKKPLRQLII